MDRVNELKTELKNTYESIGKIQDNIKDETVVLQLQCVRESILEAMNDSLKNKIETVINKAIEDFNNKWQSHEDRKQGVSEYAREILNNL